MCPMKPIYSLDQGLSKHQEVAFNPMTKVTQVFAVFLDFLGAMQRWILKDISCVLYELLVSKIVHKRNEK